LHYVLHEAAGSNNKTYQDNLKCDCDACGVLLPSRRVELEEGGFRPMVLRDFCEHPNSLDSMLEEGHVVALRLYSTAAFASINTPLRELASGEREEPHCLPITVAFLDEGVKKLRAVMARRTEVSMPRGPIKKLPSMFAATSTEDIRLNSVQPPKVLYRGMRDVQLKRSFFKAGGTVCFVPCSLLSISVPTACRHMWHYIVTARAHAHESTHACTRARERAPHLGANTCMPRVDCEGARVRWTGGRANVDDG
jgi:hypothetical protein